MTKLTVFRFENADGDGPWSGDYCGPYAGSRLPCPQSDDHLRGPMACPGRWFCSAQNLSLFRRWFNKFDRERLSQRGFFVRVYEAPENAFVELKHQTLFDKSKAKLVGSLDPVTLAPISATN